MAPLRAAIRRTVTAIGSQADGLIPAWRAALTRGLTVFVFHDITSHPSSFQRAGRSFTSPQVFSEQLSWISTRFNIVSPVSLRQLGGYGTLPINAALITFDDSWAGIFRIALPMLRERGVPAICFLNMGTVAGDPDLSAVSRYERAMALPQPLLANAFDRATGARVLSEIRERYGEDPSFRTYQGPTATHDDLAAAARAGGVWFGSHLFHHWDLRRIRADLYEQSVDDNLAALAAYPNRLPAYSTPYGYAGNGRTDPSTIPATRGARIVFTATGNQNPVADRPTLDRVGLPPEPSSAQEWWYATHRNRLLGWSTN